MDHYAVLGVLPSAEDVVIKAAYRALAQRYHPDKFSGSPQEASRRMLEINEAYAVLSDPIKRKAYDSQRGAGAAEASDYFSEGAGADEPSYDPLESDWRVAAQFYPELHELDAQLKKIAWRLAFSFRAGILSSKQFDKAKEIAASMEKEFLESYFGRNPQIVEFARDLIFANNKKAALALNRAVCVLGDIRNPGDVIRKIRDGYCPADFRTTADLRKEQEQNWWLLSVIMAALIIGSLILMMV